MTSGRSHRRGTISDTERGVSAEINGEVDFFARFNVRSNNACWKLSGDVPISANCYYLSLSGVMRDGRWKMVFGVWFLSLTRKLQNYFSDK